MSLMQLRMEPSNYHDFGAHVPIDLVYLSRQTMGNVKIERDLLALFKVQCENCRNLLSGLNPDEESVAASQEQEKLNAEIALRMKGSANAVGAWDIAKSALALECAPLEHRHINALARDINIAETYLVSIS